MPSSRRRLVFRRAWLLVPVGVVIAVAVWGFSAQQTPAAQKTPEAVRPYDPLP